MEIPEDAIQMSDPEKEAISRRAPKILIGLSLLFAAIGALIGGGDDGADWAFEMPAVALFGLLGVAAGFAGVIVSMVQLAKERDKKRGSGLFFLVSIAAVIPGLYVIIRAIEASASV